MGGILVRQGQDLQSTQEVARLSTGATVKELELVGDRLHYELLTGSGPTVGWVSVIAKTKILLVRNNTALSPRTLEFGRRIAVVTGANKGIGYYTAKQLSEKGLQVILACRDEGRGRQAAKSLSADFEPLNLDSSESIVALSQRLAQKYGKVDILVNNGATIGEPSTPFAQRTAPTLRTNLYGLVELTDAVLPCLRIGRSPRIVNLGSVKGALSNFSVEVAGKFNSPQLDRAGLFALVKQFETDVRAGRHGAMGWGSSNYGFSKLCVMAYTKIVAREEGSIMRVNCAEPGNCLTDLNPHLGNLPPEVGARTSVMLALLPDGGPTGELFKDERPYRW